MVCIGTFCSNSTIFWNGLFPVGTWHQNDIVLTSMQHKYVASTSLRHRFDVMCLLCFTWTQCQNDVVLVNFGQAFSKIWNSNNGMVKYCRPWSDCSFRCSLIWVCTVCSFLSVTIITLKCLSIGTPKTINFPFVPNGKLMFFRCSNVQAHYNEAVLCQDFGTPENNEFSIWDKWKI